MNFMKKLDLRYHLKCILRDRGMSQVELADKLNMTPTNLNTRLARGKKCQIDLLDKIAKMLNVSIDELMEGKSSNDTGIPSQTVAELEEIMYREKFEAAQSQIIELLQELAYLKQELHHSENLSKASPRSKAKNGD